MNNHIVTLDPSTFDSSVLQRSGLVLVDFWAAWCGPCRAIAPILDAVAAENAGSVLVGKVDVEAHAGLAETHSVQAIPTLIFFKDGVEVERVVGSVTKDALQQKLDQYAAAA